MPAPASVDEFLELVQKSGVVDDTKLANYLKKLKDAGPLPTDPSKCAGKFVRDAILTYFQAEQLLQGKWKRFTIGKYKVLEKLGVGGMGQVFLCEHKLMRRRVAVKVLPAAKGQDDASRERFYQEARAVAALDHPNIVRAYDIDHDEGLHFLVMEFVDGVNLQDLVKRSGPLDPLRACHYIYGSAVGLQYANETGIIHRDIKPGNILIDRSGVVKILDMGLARFFNDEDDSLTKKYDENVLGTADYLAPEQAVDSHTVKITADLYSLGGTFYFLLTGQPPFPEGSVAQKLLWHQTRDPKPILQIRPEVPVEIVRIVEKLMKKDPNDRYPMPGDLMAVLQEFVQVPIPPPSDKELPALSPAAAGNTASANRAPSGVLLAGGNPLGGTTQSTFEMRSPYAGVSVPGSSSHDKPIAAMPAPATAVATAPQAADVQVGVWATLEGDTAPRDSVETARTKKPDSLAGVKLPVEPIAKPSRSKIYVGVGVAALLAACGIGYVALKPPANPKGATVPAAMDFSRVYVTKGDGPANAPVFKSVLDAMAAINKRPEFDEATRKGAGPVIVLLDEHHQENAFSLSATGRLRDMTIEAEDVTKPVHWTTPAGTNAKRILEIRRSPGLTIRGIAFDAEGQLDYGLILGGGLAGVKIEDVTVRGARRAAIRFENAAGEAGKPCTLSRVRITVGADADAGLLWTVPEKIAGPNPNLNSFLTVTNCRIEGPAGAAVAVDTALQKVEFVQNRIFNVANGIHVRQPIPPAGPFKLDLLNNTFHTLAGSAFHCADHDLPANADVAFAKNYFAGVKAIGTVRNLPGVPGFKAADNVRDRTSGDGNLAAKSAPLEGYELPKPDPDNDRTFLRYPRSAALATAGPNKTPVGATPE